MKQLDLFSKKKKSTFLFDPTREIRFQKSCVTWKENGLVYRGRLRSGFVDHCDNIISVVGVWITHVPAGASPLWLGANRWVSLSSILHVRY